MWIRNCELFKNGRIDIDTFDQLTKKRIVRLLTVQEERLEEQQKQLEEVRKEQDRNMNRKPPAPRNRKRK